MKRTPQALIEQEIPAQFAAVQAQLSPAQKQVSIKFGVDISNAGQWTLRYANGALNVKNGLDNDCDINILTSIDSFNAAINNNEQVANFDPSKIDAGKYIQRLKPELADQVRQITGTLKAGVLDVDEELMSVTIKFGAAAPATPTCEIYIQENDIEELVSGRMNPQQAFMAGKIQIKGDMTIAMQLAALMMS